MSPQAKVELGKKNDVVIGRNAARREVRRLRQNKKKVTPELLAQAGFGAMVTEAVTRKRKVAVTVLSKSGPVMVKANRQTAAKELGIKNRRWMTVAELDEAINIASEMAAGTQSHENRLRGLEQLGRDRCRAAWDAWKAKKAPAKK